MLAFYIIICTAVFIYCLSYFTKPGPTNNKEALQDAVCVIGIVVLWPLVIVIILIAFLLKWISQ